MRLYMGVSHGLLGGLPQGGGTWQPLEQPMTGTSLQNKQSCLTVLEPHGLFVLL